MKIQDVFEALADENRRKILELLKKKDMAVGEIAQHFTMNDHLPGMRSYAAITIMIWPTKFFQVGKPIAEYVQTGDISL